MTTRLDKLLDYLVCGPGFDRFIIEPCEDAAMYAPDDGKPRFVITIINGPLSDTQMYRGSTVEEAIKFYLKDLTDSSYEKLNSDTEELKLLQKI